MTEKKEPRIVEGAVSISLTMEQAVAMLLREQGLKGELAELIRKALIDSLVSNTKEATDG